MNRRELWENFVKSGKVSDYLRYKNAECYDFDGYDAEAAAEFYTDDPNLEEMKYDAEDGRYNNP